MNRAFCLCFFLLLAVPLVTLAFTPFIAQPKNAADVLTIRNPEISQEFFGTLTDYPHTFEFVTHDELKLSAKIFAHATTTPKNDISIIVIQEQQRGVLEIGRTLSKEARWERAYDTILAESFTYGDEVTATLAPGVYRVEVSSPDNAGAYRLMFGEDNLSYTYGENLKRLFAVKNNFGSPFYTVAFSPLVYIPLRILAICIFIFLAWRSLNSRNKLPRHEGVDIG